MKNNARRQDIVYYSVVAVAAVLLVWLELLKPQLCADGDLNGILTSSLSRLVGFGVFFMLTIRMKYNVLGIRRKGTLKALAVCLPALAVVVNNFPFYGFFSGAITVTKGYLLVPYIFQSVMIGLFEETAFRGVLFPYILEKHKESNRSIFMSAVISSAAFGLVHLFNLAAGAGMGGVVLQIGYSFLIGGMCSIVMLKTRCVWICALLHAIFDFGGFFVPTVADGVIWDALTVTVTAVLGCAVLAHMLFVLHRVTPEEADALYF